MTIFPAQRNDFEVSKSPVLSEVIIFEDRSDAPKSDEEHLRRCCNSNGFNGKGLGLGKDKLFSLDYIFLNFWEVGLFTSFYSHTPVRMEAQPYSYIFL